MTHSRRDFLTQGALAAAALALPRGARALPDVSLTPNAAAPPGPFAPTWDSLAQYRTPDWFRDAKFGMWAHWGPQCVPEQGDWYGRLMYVQGERRYVAHVARYGHPSKVGFKDVIRTWKADAWRPDDLVALYAQAGAKYFMALANHHDNFDLWDSVHQPWNSVAVGPRKNLVGGWSRAARRAGLRFGVSVHASRAWSWYEVAQGSDTTGPLAGVPYDGRLTRAQGAGHWWAGLDPQDLYEQRHAPGRDLVWDWDAAKGSSVPDAAYVDRFYRRTADLMDRYAPDMIYFDDDVLPLYPISDVGLRLAARFYNASVAKHGSLEAVITGKILDEAQRRCLVWDIERGVADRLQPLPFQTDTCLGDWHYDRSIYLHHWYKTPQTVAQMLVDIVSKNGNLMLNVPLPGEGAPDDDELRFIADFGRWMGVNSRAIYSTRPWRTYGEGPSTVAAPPVQGSGFNEGKNRPYTAEDVRYVQKGETLCAFAMAWPEGGRLVLKSLATGTPNDSGRVDRVELLGAGPVRFSRDAEGLAITMPEQRVGEYVWAFEITGAGLTRPG